ncbi:ABC transporter substrate-binding protein [Actinomadura parmotrematis]|uniref:ABC transporter substrate-binding protein n=1 Tax=Actinomadura parmotrematis TaxID=2864039 RepID=A0ABS7FZB4_9ACTN|nr:ABC transporter substrate-binding protein [Actinomadura parmotrematis]MBW8485606.1 ABC transporter substrate-binding protein [Actinomadura parmotrematis]
MRSVRTLGAALMAGVLALAAGCGDSGDGKDGKDGGAKPISVQASNGTVTLPAVPKRIVSLAPTHTESLFAIGAGAQVVAADEYSTYPANAPRTKLSGFTPNAEAIIKYKPDLVVLSNDQSGIVAALGKVRIPVLLEPAAATLDEAYDEILDLGKATGHEDAAAKVTAGMRTAIQKAVAGAAKPAAGERLTYFHELDEQLDTVTSKTFIGQVYGLFGLGNVADAADKTGGGYPKLSGEALLKADPDLVFLADTKCCGQSAAAAAERPGWSSLTAVRKGQVVALDDDVASRWGPRLPQLVQAIGAGVAKAANAR